MGMLLVEPVKLATYIIRIWEVKAMIRSTIRNGALLVVLILCAIPGIVRAAEEAPVEPPAEAPKEAPKEDPIPKLIQALQDPDAIVRMRAAKSLGEMGAKAEPAIEALKKALNDEDEDVRLVAKRALERVQVQANPELTKLIADLRDPDALNRLRAAKALGDLGSKAAPALPALQQALTDQDEDVRRVVQHAIDKIQSSGSPKVHRLIEQLRDKDALVRLTAAKQLGEMGAEAQPAVEALRAAREDPDEVVRMVAKNALKKLEASGQVVVNQGGEDLTEAIGKITIVKTERIFNPPETSNGFLRERGSMRFFVTLKNTSQQTIRIVTLRVHWFMGAEEIQNTDVDGPFRPLLPGQTRVHTFVFQWSRDSKWDHRSKSTVEVSLATPVELGQAERAKLEAIQKEMASLQLINPKPIFSFGIVMGDQFTIQNTSSGIVKGALIWLRGYDPAKNWVQSVLYYAPLLPKGFTHIKNDPYSTSSRSIDTRPLVKLVDSQDVVPSPKVKRYDATVLAVGLEEDELPR